MQSKTEIIEILENTDGTTKTTILLDEQDESFADENQSSTKIQPKFPQTSKELFLNKTSKVKLIVFSFLPGCTLFHKIALLDRGYREKLLHWGLLDQEKILTVKRLKHKWRNSVLVQPYS